MILILSLTLSMSLADPLLRIEPGEVVAEPTVIANLPADTRPGERLTQEVGERWLTLALVHEDGMTGPAILGRYEHRDGTLRFTPRFALEHGKLYRARYFVDGREKAAVDHRVPARKITTQAEVTSVFPTGAEVPTNLLKFYVTFSKPMREGKEIFDHFQLLDADGKAIEDPWRRTELWNDDATRLTLWIHPGRIKQGIALRDEIGPVLEPRKTYTLVVSAKMLDGEGAQLVHAYRKEFRTIEPAKKPLKLDDWKLLPPKAGTMNALEVRFPQPLDLVLIQRCLKVVDADGKRVIGQVEIGKGELTWSFRPDQPWRKGTYQLQVDERLEDLAGNSILRPFDFDRLFPEIKDPKRELSFEP